MHCHHPHHAHPGEPLHTAPHREGRHSRFQNLAWVLVVTFLYFIAEVIGGLMTHSLALLADAAHMLADVGSVALALFALWMAEKPASPQRTYGYHRIEILAALLNGLFLAVVALGILYESYGRLLNPQPVAGEGMLWVALGGLLVNLFAVSRLHASQGHNLNVRGAYLHVLGDLLGSVGAVIAAILIWTQGLTIADPLFSAVIACLVLYSAGKLLLEAVHILLESSPAHLNVAAIKAAMLATEGVASVHDLHVWTITSGKDALSAHVVVLTGQSHHDVLKALQQGLKAQFGISHLTLQLEPPDFEEDALHF